jgi:hypothetical protein
MINFSLGYNGLIECDLIEDDSNTVRSQLTLRVLSKLKPESVG